MANERSQGSTDFTVRIAPRDYRDFEMASGFLGMPMAEFGRLAIDDMLRKESRSLDGLLLGSFTQLQRAVHTIVDYTRRHDPSSMEHGNRAVELIDRHVADLAG